MHTPIRLFAESYRHTFSEMWYVRYSYIPQDIPSSVTSYRPETVRWRGVSFQSVFLVARLLSLYTSSCNGSILFQVDTENGTLPTPPIKQAYVCLTLPSPSTTFGSSCIYSQMGISCLRNGYLTFLSVPAHTCLFPLVWWV